MQVPSPAVRQARKPRVDPPYVTVFIQQCLPSAREVKAKYGVPIAVTIAQAADESAWGRQVVDNAYFGVKGKVKSGDTTAFMTHEMIDGKNVLVKQDFRAYKDFAEAADDYGHTLSTQANFRPAFLYIYDSTRFVKELKKAGYATAPNYVAAVTSIIRTHHLDDYDK